MGEPPRDPSRPDGATSAAPPPAVPPPTEAARDAATDAELLALHRDGDTDAFGALVRRHRDRLWAVAVRTLGDREEAADALQEALISAYRASASSAAGASSASSAFRGEAAVTTWLHRIVVNACIDQVRRRRVRPTVPLPEDGSGRPLHEGRDAVDASEIALVVSAALATLPVEQRAALVLVDMQGWSVEEAARMLDVAPGTIKSRCSRGRARLLPLLAGLRRNPEPDPAVPSGRPAGRPDHDDGGEH